MMIDRNVVNKLLTAIDGRTSLERILRGRDDFKESDHPRSPDGKFGSGGGSSGSSVGGNAPKGNGESKSELLWPNQLRNIEHYIREAHKKGTATGSTGRARQLLEHINNTGSGKLSPEDIEYYEKTTEHNNPQRSDHEDFVSKLLGHIKESGKPWGPRQTPHMHEFLESTGFKPGQKTESTTLFKQPDSHGSYAVKNDGTWKRIQEGITTSSGTGVESLRADLAKLKGA